MTEKTYLERISVADAALTERYAALLRVNKDLDRTLVSFQASKTETDSRWFKYREGFSSSLMRYAFDQLGLTSGVILDPFAGSGTALFAAASRGMDATGIELLPSSAESIEVRRLLLSVDRSSMAAGILGFAKGAVWKSEGEAAPFPHVGITKGAFPPENERQLGRYLHALDHLDDRDLARVLRFAALCILESISYTRKDGQYLRWDHRSGRRAGIRPFDKGKIWAFTDAILCKLYEIASDIAPETQTTVRQIELFETSTRAADLPGSIALLSGSCLDLMPGLTEASFDALVTSPPYCNRYDYTRTYALELAMMGATEESLRSLRQTMLSCTVENREKQHLVNQFPPDRFSAADEAWRSQEMLGLVLEYLYDCRQQGSLNNSGIPRMIQNYFAEMALIIFESARVLRPGAPLVMVNDNVRYQGAHVPVDLILSDIARSAGFDVDAIWVLPKGKGNSSQQMGVHGRQEIRKCVYIWRRSAVKPTARPSRNLAVASV